MKNWPVMLFDALVLPAGAEAMAALVAALDADACAHARILRLQYWHCKTTLAFGASQALLT